MSSTMVWGLAGLGISLFAIFLVYRWNRYSKQIPNELAGQTLKVWAALGPYKSGVESARALRAAYQAVLGSDVHVSIERALKEHSKQFDEDPDKWEGIRCKSPTPEQLDEETRRYVRLAREIFAGDCHG